MAQQKSEGRVVLEGGVMPVEPAGSSAGGRGKAVPVDELTGQLCLPIVTAERRARVPDRSGTDRGLSALPKAIVNAQIDASVTMEGVVSRLTSALLKVASNKGAPGPDGQTIEALCEQWPTVLPKLSADLLAGTYRPGEIRRAYIPKAGGGQRGLGIPTVTAYHKVVQAAFGFADGHASVSSAVRRAVGGAVRSPHRCYSHLRVRGRSFGQRVAAGGCDRSWRGAG